MPSVFIFYPATIKVNQMRVDGRQWEFTIGETEGCRGTLLQLV